LVKISNEILGLFYNGFYAVMQTMGFYYLDQGILLITLSHIGDLVEPYEARRFPVFGSNFLRLVGAVSILLEHGRTRTILNG
jgi:hypothetical protein